jgi:hypothetical protein
MSGLGISSNPSWRQRFWARVADYAQRASGALETGREHAASQERPSQAISVEEFANRLKEAGARRPGTPLGAIHIINIERLKAHFGEQWPGMLPKIEALARRVIEQKLTPVDVYSAFPGPTFLIVFGNLMPESAKFKCAAIAAEIERRILGQEASLNGLLVRAAVAELGGTLKVDAISPEQILSGMLHKSREEAHAESKLMVSSLDAAEKLEQAAKQDPGWISDAADPAPSEAKDWKPIASIFEDVDLPDIEFIYRPIWHVRYEALASYYCLPVISDPVHGPMPDQPLVLDPSAAASLDQLVLDRVAADCRASAEIRRRGLIGFPVRFHTLAEPRLRRKVEEQLQRLKDYRGTLIGEIVDIPEGTPGQRLYEAVAAIQPAVRVTTMRVSIQRRDFSALLGMRIYAVGVEAPMSRSGEPAFMKAAESFTAAANAAGLHSYVRGLRSLSVTTASIAAGFDFIDGDAVASLVDAPGSMHHFDTADLFRRALGERREERTSAKA